MNPIIIVVYRSAGPDKLADFCYELLLIDFVILGILGGKSTDLSGPADLYTKIIIGFTRLV